MPKLILIRHSQPQIEPGVPAHQWKLSESGRVRCRPLAERLADHDPTVIVSSVELKAVETARGVAELLGCSLETALGLHEHERHGLGLLGAEQFEVAVAGLFARPGERVMGEESADQAHQRFARAVDGVIRQHAGRNVAVVTHGTVMTLFVTRAAGLEPFPFWRQLGLPAFVVLSLPALELLEVAVTVTPEGEPLTDEGARSA
jgi:broad specificity phosphatase PhoE